MGAAGSVKPSDSDSVGAGSCHAGGTPEVTGAGVKLELLPPPPDAPAAAPPPPPPLGAAIPAATGGLLLLLLQRRLMSWSGQATSDGCEGHTAAAVMPSKQRPVAGVTSWRRQVRQPAANSSRPGKAASSRQVGEALWSVQVVCRANHRKWKFAMQMWINQQKAGLHSYVDKSGTPRMAASAAVCLLHYVSVEVLRQYGHTRSNGKIRHAHLSTLVFQCDY